MKSNQTFSILFWVYKSKIKNGKAPIYCRVSINSKRVEIATKHYIEPEKWSVANANVKGNSEESRIINNYLSMMKGELFSIYNMLVLKKDYVNADKIKNLYLGIVEKEHTLLEVFKYHNDLMKERVGIDVVRATYSKFETIYNKLKVFLKKKYKVSDINIKELKHKFAVDLEHYFRVTEQLQQNTTMKYIRNLKKVMNMCVANDWLVKNPFQNFKCPNKSTIRDILTKEEIIKLENKKMEIPRLDEVRDIFLFCCYTGLAFVDVEKLTMDEVTIGIDGKKWIFTTRKKTGITSNIPLLPKAVEILNKYNSHPCRIVLNRLMPVKSNQKMNAYLKEIATLCEIKKLLTMHIARHTFATTITLSNGVPIETVSKMLGHTKLATTQIYAKVLETKVSEDMEKLRMKLYESPKKATKQKQKIS